MSGSAAGKGILAHRVPIAEIEIDPPQLESYKLAAAEHAEAAIRVEPGVLALYAIAAADQPAHVTVFEIYRDIDAYEAHLESAHFKKYKTTTQAMVKSLKLTNPIVPAAKK